MGKLSFYNSTLYKEKQSVITKDNWRKGIYNTLHKQEEKRCKYKECRELFITTPRGVKKFCSRSCAAKVNNSRKSNMTLEAMRNIKKLYKSGMSVQEISSKINRSNHQIIYWMDKSNISRRPRSDAMYIKSNPDGDPFRIKTQLTREEEFLNGLGLGIYWGEGDKGPGTSVRVGNTDPSLIETFRNFLLKICGVREEKIRYSLILFNDAKEKEAIQFWKNKLGIRRTQLGQIVTIPPQGRGTYKRKNKTGVLTIVVSNTKLKARILEMISEV